jgi:hypothetical protein
MQRKFKSQRQESPKEVESATDRLIAQLFARLLTVAAVAAVAMFIVMAGVWFRARRKSVVGPDDTTRTPHLLHHLE